MNLSTAAIESLGRARPPAARAWGLAPHALFTASRDLFRRCEKSHNGNTFYSRPIWPSREKRWRCSAMLRGPSTSSSRALGARWMTAEAKLRWNSFRSAVPEPPGGRRPTTWIVAHLNELTESDFDLLERLNSRFHIVHCPRSHNYFGHSPFAFERLRSLGFNVCLGTDSLASNQSLSLFDEMRAFQKNFPQV